MSSSTTARPWRSTRKASGSSKRRRVLGSSQSRYSASRERQRTLLPARRTPISQTTDRRVQASSDPWRLSVTAGVDVRPPGLEWGRNRGHH